VTTPLYAPPEEETVILTLTELPEVTETAVLGADNVKVGAAPTVNVSTAEVEAAKAAFPEYAAVMLSEPVGRLLVVAVARPEELTVAEFSKVDPL
jgi:hypothetical protein